MSTHLNFKKAEKLLYLKMFEDTKGDNQKP